jgi:hypothetical protein
MFFFATSLTSATARLVITCSDAGSPSLLASWGSFFSPGHGLEPDAGAMSPSAEELFSRILIFLATHLGA